MVYVYNTQSKLHDYELSHTHTYSIRSFWLSRCGSASQRSLFRANCVRSLRAHIGFSVKRLNPCAHNRVHIIQYTAVCRPNECAWLRFGYVFSFWTIETITIFIICFYSFAVAFASVVVGSVAVAFFRFWPQEHWTARTLAFDTFLCDRRKRLISHCFRYGCAFGFRFVSRFVFSFQNFSHIETAIIPNGGYFSKERTGHFGH